MKHPRTILFFCLVHRVCAFPSIIRVHACLRMQLACMHEWLNVCNHVITYAWLHCACIHNQPGFYACMHIRKCLVMRLFLVILCKSHLWFQIENDLGIHRPKAHTPAHDRARRTWQEYGLSLLTEETFWHIPETKLIQASREFPGKDVTDLV